jgi:hypothetical protein
LRTAEKLEDGDFKFYAEAEAVLSHLKRRGIPMILREIEDGKSRPYSFSGMQKIVQRMRKEIGLPKEFTLDACRHGGMTELEEAELTEGQRRALGASHTRELCGIREANRGPYVVGYEQAACAHAGEPTGNKRSERGG